MRTIIRLLMGAMLLSSSSYALEFAQQEIMVIPWGNGLDSLPAYPPDTVEADAPAEGPIEPGQGYLMPVGGPSEAFVDKFGNVYVNYDECLRIFDKNGKQTAVFDSNNFKFDGRWIKCTRPIYVDSLRRIFFVSANMLGFLGYSGLYVMDSTGAVLRKFTLHSGKTNVEYFNRGSNDVLTLVDYAGHYYTLRGDSVSEGGGYGWLAKDGYYYYVSSRDSTKIRLIRYKDPDWYGRAKLQDSIFLDFGAARRGAALFGIDDSMRIFIESWEGDTLGTTHREIDVFDTTYTKIGGFDLHFGDENKFLYSLNESLYFRTDGSILKFRCLDDGLHVVRWSRIIQ